MNRKIDTTALGAGLALIAIGILTLVERYDLVEFGDLVRRFWPLALILIGIPKLVRRATVWNGLWLIAVGTWLQLVHLDFLGMTYRNSWPLLLIALGGGMIARVMVDVALPEEERHEQRQ